MGGDVMVTVGGGTVEKEKLDCSVLLIINTYFEQ